MADLTTIRSCSGDALPIRREPSQESQAIIMRSKMSHIQEIRAREILDSRGNPTVECDVLLASGAMGRAAVPSGASTGEHEAVEMAGNGPEAFLWKRVLKGVENN